MLTFLKTLQELNSLFDHGCEISLDEEHRSLCVEGADYGPEHLMESEAENGHALDASWLKRQYSCEPYKLIAENTPDEDYVFDEKPVKLMIEQIKMDNQKAKAKTHLVAGDVHAGSNH